jgi:hypothetical protein
MGLRLRLGAVVLVFLLTNASSSAQAQWRYEKAVDNPFENGAGHFAHFRSLDGAVGAFSCVDRATYGLAVVSAQRVDTRHNFGMRGRLARLVVIVDDSQRIAIAADLKAGPRTSFYTIVARLDDRDVARVMHLASKAKQRFVVAAELEEKVLWSHVFGVAGASAAIDAMVQSCRHLTSTKPN